MNFGVHTEGTRPSDAHSALVHCLAGIRKRHQQWNEWMASSAASQHQFDAIITAIDLSARIEENDARAS